MEPTPFSHQTSKPLPTFSFSSPSHLLAFPGSVIPRDRRPMPPIFPSIDMTSQVVFLFQLCMDSVVVVTLALQSARLALDAPCCTKGGRRGRCCSPLPPSHGSRACTSKRLGCREEERCGRHGSGLLHAPFMPAQTWRPWRDHGLFLLVGRSERRSVPPPPLPPPTFLPPCQPVL